MTTVQTRVRLISNKEGFEIVVKRNSTGKQVNIRKNGVLGPWSHSKKTKDNMTVAGFRTKFEEAYPGYSCIVEKADGTAATGQLTLGSLRAGYDD